MIGKKISAHALTILSVIIFWGCFWASGTLRPETLELISKCANITESKTYVQLLAPFALPEMASTSAESEGKEASVATALRKPLSADDQLKKQQEQKDRIQISRSKYLAFYIEGTSTGGDPTSAISYLHLRWLLDDFKHADQFEQKLRMSKSQFIQMLKLKKVTMKPAIVHDVVRAMVKLGKSREYAGEWRADSSTHAEQFPLIHIISQFFDLELSTVDLMQDSELIKRTRAYESLVPTLGAWSLAVQTVALTPADIIDLKKSVHFYFH